MSTPPLAMRAPVERTDNITELLWQDALRHLRNTNNEVLLPLNVVDIIGQRNVDKIKTRLSMLIGTPTVAFLDESINALRILQTPAFSGTAVALAAPIKEPATEIEAASITIQAIPVKQNKIPRPPNAFILYRQNHHPKVKESNPALTNNEISILLGKQWKAEPEEVKAEWRKLAEETKRKHAEEHPDYQYTPRKPSEKKRRGSSRPESKPTKRFHTPAATSTESEVGSSIPDTSLSTISADAETPNHNLADLESVVGSDEPAMIGGPYRFSAAELDNLIAEVESENQRAMIFASANFGMNERLAGEPFELSDFLADIY
ncbi:HMG-box domain-containing protein [Aspergillus aculeatinus CBS 121060]|uniref:Mating-type HMG-box protein MAT1-2 n=1 Tax=Aspergillus aculeatinus CBS 121060 TaxID=1448322 RepID=A0ACD1GRS6_9EURO|nr:mating-type HMG-box protein MAT1-2 [Aspergillus aculeatinus CBS 121060]RAH64040.1 mating-type HMG-box protein MAT1-2 [Aspergillus aculeatinus CBS 121060]